MGCIPSKCPSVLYDTDDVKDKSDNVNYYEKNTTVTGIPTINIGGSLTHQNPFLQPGIIITGRIILAAEIWKIAIHDINRVENVCELTKFVCIWSELNKEKFENTKELLEVSVKDMSVLKPFLYKGLPST